MNATNEKINPLQSVFAAESDFSFKRLLELSINLTRRELKIRYLGSILGGVWNFFHPLVLILIYTLIFSRIMQAKLGESSGPFDYSMFLCSGLLLWNFLSETVLRGCRSLVDNSAFIKKIRFPPFVLFIANGMTSWVSFAVGFGFFLALLTLIKGISPLLGLASLFVVIAAICFAIALSMIAGCLNVFLRDVEQMATIVFQLWFWFTPIVYMPEILPLWAKKWVLLNPVYPFVSALQDLLFRGVWPSETIWFMLSFWTSLALLAGIWVYRKTISLIRDQL